MFEHWKLHDHLVSVGWDKSQVEHIKEGIVDAIRGDWRDDLMRYDYNLNRKAPSDEVEEAYVTGHRIGEELLEQWLTRMGTTISLDPSITGGSIGALAELKSTAGQTADQK